MAGFTVLLAGMLLAACSGRAPQPAGENAGPGPAGGIYGQRGTAPGQPIAVTERFVVGKVVRVHTQGRFAVLNFPVGRLPELGQVLSVYRGGLKVGEVKITGPQMDDNVVGDISAGTAEPGDEARQQ